MTKRYNNRRKKLNKNRLSRGQIIALIVTAFIALTMVASVFAGIAATSGT
jgi:hypothetical protein